MFGYTEALDFVMQWEGGFVDDPDDRGGRTNKGVTQVTYDNYRGRKSLPAKDVLHIADGEVADIYRTMYWAVAKCDMLKDKLAFCHFDTAVNMGPNRAVRILQRATGCEEDGKFGPATQKACDDCDVGDVIGTYTEIRATFYHMFAMRPGQDKFLKGWMNRLNALRKALGLPATRQGPSSGSGIFVPEPTKRIPDLAKIAPLEDLSGG